ncbi:MAG: glucans biosynthesis glucosyltransferase MdoH [Alphaproteobacteria bacterium]|nr:glucans biosynthesis glucosyltransferase MdoH [Alphaproteobacteria bacterium]
MIALRGLFCVGVFATTAAAAMRLFHILRVDGLTNSETIFLILVTILFAWISISFWIALFGALARHGGVTYSALVEPGGTDPHLRRSRARTAILFPVRNEELGRLFSGIGAVAENICASGLAERFDIFILSDSTGDDMIGAERHATVRLRAATAVNVYYRNRTDNGGRKSGNIADFCRNWGARYDYMVVLDADSLMTAKTLAQLVRLMDANPNAALIQTSPVLVGRDSVFARMQQFASSVYGPLFSSGLAVLLGEGGNYWGHNAIIRIRPFMQCCGLPRLRGPAPFGGEILSHDFVEAALLRRAGWGVHMAADLGGSYEEPPTTLTDYLKRDRRWCQGNLQHLPLVFAQRFRAESRWHLATGVMSYVSSPLWLVLILISATVVLQQHHIAPVQFFGRYPVLSWPISNSAAFAALTGAMALLLLAPKALALVLAICDPLARRSHGGAIALTLGVLLETLFSMLFAPIAMLSHSHFVARILAGKTGGWNSQQRSEHRQSWTALISAFAPHTFAAAVAALLVYRYIPGSVWWFAPILTGPLLSIPLGAFSASVRLGLRMKCWRIFITPAEMGMVPITERVRPAATAGPAAAVPVND